MMNVGESPIDAEDVTTSLAWKIGGRVEYVLEGNINYAGAVISWLKDEVTVFKFGEFNKYSVRHPLSPSVIYRKTAHHISSANDFSLA